MREIAQALLEVLHSGLRGALATVVSVSGSTPQRPGARLLLRPDGSIVGTVGGGALEHEIVESLKEAIRTGESRKITRDLGPELGMCCGGRMEVFIEPIEATPRLLILGAGHVAKPTAALARTVGFDVLVIDGRPEQSTEERFPGCELHRLDPAEFLAQTPLTERDHVVIVTHDHRLDERVLTLALLQKPRYVGLVGSRRKVLRFAQRIGKRHPSLDLAQVYAPVGLAIGAVTPEEIAVSIVAELIALRHGKAVPHLRASDDPQLRRMLDEAAAGDAEQRPIPLRIPSRLSSGEGR